MGKGKGKVRQVGRSGKRSRFNISARAEAVLAVIGVIVVALLLFFGWSVLSPLVLKPRPSEAAAQQKLKAGQEKLWSELNRDGTLVRAEVERQDLIVDAAKWEALGLSGQDRASAAALAHFGWKQCLVYDAATGLQLGWYTPAEGYKKAERGKG